MKGRVIKYKPVAKLSGKSGAKKGGMNRNSAAGPAQVNKNSGPAPLNNNNNNDSFKYEGIATIEFKELEELSGREEELYEKLEELKQLDRDIFDISIDNSCRNCVKDTPAKISITIYFNNYSRDKKVEGFKEKLDELIGLLKFYKNAADTKILDTKFILFKPHKSFTHDYNEFLIKTLPFLIEPIKLTFFQNSKS